MNVKPIYSAAEIAAKVNAPTKQTATNNTSSAWGKDAFVPTPDESPYLTYDRVGKTAPDSKPDDVNELVPETKPALVAPNNKSVYDFSYKQLKDIMDKTLQACDELDTTGMTKGEIYKSIETIFASNFGNDFREPNILGFNSTISIQTMDAMIRGEIITPLRVHELYDEALRNKGVDGEFDTSAIIQAKYSGMTASEMRTAIQNHYPEQMTLKDCMLMQWELWEVGLDAPCAGTMQSEFAHIMGMNGQRTTLPQLELADKLFKTLLDMPADYGTFRMNFERYDHDSTTGKYAFSRTYEIDDVKDLKEKLFSMFSTEEQYSPWLEESSECETAMRALFDEGFTKPYKNND